jgi:hypothetical protein
MTELPDTYSAAEVCESFGLTAEALNKLIADGKVGYYIGRRQKRFFPEHIAQLRAAVEIAPKVQDDVLTRIGVTRRSVKRRAS